jgi:hypothetical protein
MEILMADKLESIAQTLNFKISESETTEDPLLNKFLRCIYVLDQLEAKSVTENSFNNIGNLFYSRYYWFHRFKERYFVLYGCDEGLEQQSFKMLSDYNERFPEKTDWAIIEQIENNSI